MISLAKIMTYLSRRQFVKSSALALAALEMRSAAWAQGAAGASKIRLAVQLYSLRQDSTKDFPAVLAQVAKMGFVGVEFAGYFSYAGKAKELRQKLDDLNLKVAGTHIGTGTLKGDALKQTIEFHQTIGCQYLIVPGDRDFTDSEKSKALAETFNQTAQTLKPLGMACGYHNHTGEFKKDGDKTFWHLFAERTTKDVVLQQDCGWSAAAGYNPVELMKQFPGRMKTTHFKPTIVGNDPGKKPILGQDSVDWAAVYVACRDIGGTDWAIVEQETYLSGKTPAECTEMSLVGLKKIIGA
jgi:sugar phosphate isomerase/epimerase